MSIGWRKATAVDSPITDRRATTASGPYRDRTRFSRWTTHQYADCCKRVSTRVYHTLPPAGDGNPGTHYDQSRFDYDLRDRRRSVISPAGTVTTTVFDNRGLPTALYVGTNDTGGTEDDPTGGGASGNNMLLVTESSYDLDGRLTATTQHVSQTQTRTTGFGYDWRGRRTSVTGELGLYEGATYDNLDRSVMTERYDGSASGRLLARSETAYDDRGRVYRTLRHAVDPATGAIGSSLVDNLWYDQSGNLVTREPDGVMSRSEFTYDPLGRLLTETDPRGAVTAFGYNAAGNRTALTDAEGNTTTWGYDGIGRVVRETNALGNARQFGYDDAGDLFRRTDRVGRVIEFDHDAAGRLTAERWLVGTTGVNTLTTTYDTDGRVTSLADASASYAYGYDPRGRLTSTDNAGTPGVPQVLLTADHNRLNERTRLSATVAGIPDFATSLAYDALGRMEQVTQTGQPDGNAVAAKRVDLGYAATGGFGNIARYTDTAATQPVAETSYGYDAYGRLTGLTHTRGSSTLSSYGRTFNTARRVGSATTPEGETLYGYDPAGQLTSADHAAHLDETYSYDLTGNRTNPGYQTGTNNQLLSDGTHAYAYDAEGNRVRKTVTATGESTDYAWDHRNRLKGITFKDGTGSLTGRLSYRYDPADRRIMRLHDTDGDGTYETRETFVFDQGVKQGLDDCVLVFENDVLTQRLLHGPSVDQPLAQEDAAGTVLWPLADPLGTVRDLVERNGNGGTVIANHPSYDSFGRLLSQSNASEPSRYGFTGREWDADAGLWWYRARWYDAGVGRFVSEDPIDVGEAGVNLTAYVSNSPTDFSDPEGLVKVQCTYRSARNSRTKTIMTECAGLIDSCCPRMMGGGGSAMYRSGWRIVGASPDVDAPPLCDRVPWNRMSGMDCVACCVQEYGKQALAYGAAAAGVPQIRRPKLSVFPGQYSSSSLGTKVGEQIARTPYRFMRPGQGGPRMMERLTTPLKRAKPLGRAIGSSGASGLVIGAGLCALTVEAYCACACGVK